MRLRPKRKRGQTWFAAFVKRLFILFLVALNENRFALQNATLASEEMELIPFAQPAELGSTEKCLDLARAKRTTVVLIVGTRGLNKLKAPKIPMARSADSGDCPDNISILIYFPLITFVACPELRVWVVNVKNIGLGKFREYP